MFLFKIKDGTNRQDAWASLDTNVLFKFSYPKSTEGGIFSMMCHNIQPKAKWLGVILWDILF